MQAIYRTTSPVVYFSTNWTVCCSSVPTYSVSFSFQTKEILGNTSTINLVKTTLNQQRFFVQVSETGVEPTERSDPAIYLQ